MNAVGGDDGRDQRLWCAVTMQALQDAMGTAHPDDPKRDANRQKARQWLTQPNRHFEDVCDLAGLDADHVRTFAALQIDKADGPSTPVREQHARCPKQPGLRKDL